MLRYRKLGTYGGAITVAPSYDTAVGQGVGTDGFASLPLRSGAKRIYVNSGSGSDSNSGLTNASPVATIAHAVTLATAGAGDQLLIAPGTYAEGLPDMRPGASVLSGFSAAYPTVIQSYDPTDPTNESKMGRTGTGRPVLTSSANGQTFLNGHGGQFIAVRGLDFNPGNIAACSINVLGGANNNTGYILFENCRFQYVMANCQGNLTWPTYYRMYKVIFRNCGAHGQWDTSGDQQFVYASLVDGLTIEDCSMVHVGWKEGANRSDSATLGGATIYSHPVYTQDDSRNSVMRRCVIVNSAADGGRLKSGGLYQSNLVINCPIQADAGEGNEYTIHAPTGCYHDISGNLAFGSGKIDGSAGSTWGWHIKGNAAVGSAVHHNIAARSVDGNAGNALMMDAAHDALTSFQGLPSYGNFYNNVSYLWTASGNSFVAGSSNTTNPALMTYLTNNNVWDDPTGGTNKNWSAVTFPNSYTMLGLLSAVNVSYVDLNTAQTDWQNNPESRGWRNAISLGQLGYGVAPVLQDLVTNTNLTVGVPSYGLFVGTMDGSVLSSSDLPSGVTLDSDCRFWRYDGSGSAQLGMTNHVTETNGTNSHTTTFTWNRYAQPVLSSLTATPSYNSATASFSTNVGSGLYYWEVTTESTVPDWPHIRIGVNIANTQEPATSVATVFGNANITAPGTQNISGISGLLASTAYYLNVAQLDANGNPSAVSQFAFTTTAPPAPTLSAPVSATTGTIGVTTNQNTGTMYWVVTTSSTAPTAAQVKAGQNNLGTAAVASGNKAITVAAKWATAVSGLTNGTTYYAYFCHNNAGGDSNVASTASFVPAATTTQYTNVSNWTVTSSGGTNNKVAKSTNGSWSSARTNNADSLGSVVHTLTALGTELRVGLSTSALIAGSTGNESTCFSWDVFNGNLFVAGSLVGAYSGYTAVNGNTVTLTFNNGYVYVYLNSTLVVSLDVSSIGTTLYPFCVSNDNTTPTTVTSDFTHW